MDRRNFLKLVGATVCGVGILPSATVAKPAVSELTIANLRKYIKENDFTALPEHGDLFINSGIKYIYMDCKGIEPRWYRLQEREAVVDWKDVSERMYLIDFKDWEMVYEPKN